MGIRSLKGYIKTNGGLNKEEIKAKRPKKTNAYPRDIPAGSTIVVDGDGFAFYLLTHSKWAMARSRLDLSGNYDGYQEVCCRLAICLFFFFRPILSSFFIIFVM